MKPFLFKVLLFLAPVVLMFAAIETYISLYPSTLKAKARYLKANQQNIEVLIFGSSHMDQAVNPEWFSFEAANAAYGGQDIELDHRLFERYIDSLPKLKIVVIGLTYPSLESRKGPDYWRNAMYYRYHGINNYHRKVTSADLFLFLSNPDFYLEWMRHTLFDGPAVTTINEWGFELAGEGIFGELGHDDQRVEEWAGTQRYGWHPEMDDESYAMNQRLLKDMMRQCVERGIEVVFVNTPAHRTYRLRMVAEKIERRKSFERALKATFPSVTFLDYEAHPDFVTKDFRDESHMNAKGAEKFTRLLDEELTSLLAETDASLSMHEHH